MSNVIELFNQFKSESEKEQFISKQHETIGHLMSKNRKQLEEIEHLKKLLVESTSLLNEPKVEKIILTAEEALIEGQIEILKGRSYTELTLEDVKKLDLLIKNKRLAKEQSTTIQGESKKLDKKQYSNAELIQIVNTKKGSTDEPV
jgi:hypothetical protein